MSHMSHIIHETCHVRVVSYRSHVIGVMSRMRIAGALNTALLYHTWVMSHLSHVTSESCHI